MTKSMLPNRGAALISLLYILSAGLSLSCCAQPEKSNSAVTDSIAGKANMSFRIGIGLSLQEKRFNELLDYFDTYHGVTDDITFFTAATHPPAPLEVFKERVAIFKGRMELARSRGYKAGINLLSTVGHLNENLPNSLKGDYTHITDIDGNTYAATYCLNDEKFRKEYVTEVYKAAALANPDYIWIDDDVRAEAYGNLRYPCFCNKCLQIFAQEYGVTFSRAKLKKAFNEGDINNKLDIRKKWLQHNRNNFANFFTLIEKTVHAIGPKISIGFMTGDRFYAGYDFANWSAILSGPNKVPVLWRPGGGAYDDLEPMNFIDKAHAIGRQVSVLPPNVVSIQSEIENFPYWRLKKSAAMVAFETATYMAAGATGAAYNVLGFFDEPLDEYKPLAEKLQQVRPFLNLMEKYLGRKPITGINTFWNSDSRIAGNAEKGDWLDTGTPLNSYEIYDLGLPVSYSAAHAPVTILGLDMIYAMSKDEIMKMFSTGVYMSGEVLAQVNKLGYGDLTGFEVVGTETIDQIERLTANPLNGPFAGRLRDSRQSFWMQPAYSFKKHDEKAEILSELTDYTLTTTASCTVGIFENRLGGRVCVSGYYPWTALGNLAKSSQVKSLFRWLSSDKLPGYIASFHKIDLWIRERENNRIVLALTNSSFDAAKDLVLMLNTNLNTIKVYDMNCVATTYIASASDGPYKKFVIPYVDPWQVRLIVNE